MNRVHITSLFSAIVIAGSIQGIAPGEDLADDTTIAISKTWSQQPGGWTYPMTIRVPNAAPPEGGFPVCILLHGNGGNGAMMAKQYQNQLPQHARTLRLGQGQKP